MKKKKIIFILILIIFLVGCNKKTENNFSKVDSNDAMVTEALKSLDFISSLNEDLIKKLYDYNTNKIDVNDLTNDEKLFLTLQKYNNDHRKNCIYHNLNTCNINENELENLLFNNNDFLNEYKISGKEFNIEDNIDLTYDDKIFKVNGKATEEATTKIVYKDIISARKNDRILEIDFYIAYISFDFKMDSPEYEDILYYKYIDDLSPIDVKYNQLKEETDFGKLNNKYNSFRLSFLIDNDKIYFKLIEKIQ